MKIKKYTNFCFYILAPILLTSTGELFLKHNINNMHLALNPGTIFLIVANPFVLLSILFIIFAGVLWIVGLSKFQLSFMYPFLTLNYVLITTGSIIYLKEKVSLYTVLAILFIMIGLIFISRSSHSET
ncbi:MAG: hypothetical protein WC860_01105 [Candidatus Margulisiibacteriota bacterium]|jgi:drug/metabolite transporter (DMT)-like permease